MALNPQWAHLAHLIRTTPHWGANVYHLRPDGSECVSFITFDTELTRAAGDPGEKWQVKKWEPLTISPSLLCRACGDHGHIREGRWVKA